MFIELNNVRKSIKGNVILKDISLRFESGNIYGLQGKNGSGKTMLMRAICGLIKTEGSININGEILHKDISFPRSIGILIENPSFIPNYTGRKNLKLLAELEKKVNNSDINSILEKVGLDPEDKRTYRKYSLGMKQKLGIAAAIMGKPDIVILDEPINAIDEEGVERVRTILKDLKNNGSIVIVACHDREELELLADKIIQVKDGGVEV